MWILEGSVGILVVTVLFAVVAQLSAMSPAQAQTARSVAPSPSVTSGASAGPAAAKPSPKATRSGSGGVYANASKRVRVSGPITFQGSQAVQGESATGREADQVKKPAPPNCSALEVVATDTSGKTVAAAAATKGSQSSTCAYELRVPFDTALEISVHPRSSADPSTAASASAARSASTGDIKVTPLSKPVGRGFQKYTASSQTVPLSITTQP